MQKFKTVILLPLIILAACSKPETNALAPLPRTQAISVMTPGQAGAHCFLQAGPRSYVTQTPGNVKVTPAPDTMDVTCFKGEHMVGSQKVFPTVSQKEAASLLGTDNECVSCNYPPMISVAMSLDRQSMIRTVTEIK